MHGVVRKGCERWGWWYRYAVRLAHERQILSC
jgi:hypothetical protein